MYHKDKTEWNIITSVQARLYELFGIEEWLMIENKDFEYGEEKQIVLTQGNQTGIIDYGE